nr:MULTISPECIES: helix-hairpin-helix domain-containing protein [unclassified Nannocystis]
MRGEDLEALAIPVDLNYASAPELESLPGIGPELARRIVEGRPYATVDDLNRVRGIGPARLTAVRPRARVQTSGQDP